MRADEDVVDVPPRRDERGRLCPWQAPAVPEAVHLVAERDDDFAAELLDGIGVPSDRAVVPASDDPCRRCTPRIELDQRKVAEGSDLLCFPSLEGPGERVVELDHLDPRMRHVLE